MLDDPVVLNDWYAAADAPDLTEGKPMGASLLEEGLSCHFRTKITRSCKSTPQGDEPDIFSSTFHGVGSIVVSCCVPQ
jgi:hypothetical protein